MESARLTHEDDVQLAPVPAKVVWLDYRPFRAVKSTDKDKYEYESPRVEDVLKQGALVVCVEPERSLPTGEFHVELKFDQNPPIELTGQLRQTLKLYVPQTALDPKAVIEEKKMGMRSLTNKLDAAVAATSAVKDVEKEVEGKKVTVRERDNDWSPDLLVAPTVKERRDAPTKAAWMKFVTPYFLDLLREGRPAALRREGRKRLRGGLPHQVQPPGLFGP